MSTLQVPEKEMSQHTRQHVVMPPGVFTYFIVIHPQFCFRFFNVLIGFQGRGM